MKSQEELKNELESLKKKYDKVHEVEVLLDDTEENICTVFFKHPDRKSYSQIANFLGGFDNIKGLEVFVKGNYIGGDEMSLLTNNDYALRSLDSVVANIMWVKQSSLKKN
jgi:hypothetical protein